MSGQLHEAGRTVFVVEVQPVADVGGACGALCISLAQRRERLKLTTFDLPLVETVARRTVERAGLAGRISVASGDFFADVLPQADVIVMENVLHDWGENDKLLLIKKA